jgi:hypothetical protein
MAASLFLGGAEHGHLPQFDGIFLSEVMGFGRMHSQ